MTEGQDIQRALRLRSGWLLRTGLLAAGLAALVSWLLPGEWESTALLLPPDRRTDEFRYVDETPATAGGGIRRVLGAFEQIDDVHPLDVWEAVVGSAGTAERLIDRFDLLARWRCRGREEAVRRLEERLSFESIPYGGFEIRVRTRDRQLSADLANAAAGILEERLRELYREDVAWERDFLEEAARERLETARLADAALGASRLRSGLFEPEEQEREDAARARDLVLAVADARTDRAEAVRRSGRGSAAERDAARRVQELAKVAGALPVVGVPEPGERALEADAAKLQKEADYLARLRYRTIQHQAAHDVGVRMLDPAIPAETAERPLARSALFAFLFVPASFAGVGVLRGLRAGLPAELREGLARLALPPGLAAALSRWRTPALAALAAVVGLLVAREPFVLVGLLGIVFLIALAVDVRGAWFLLVLALPWAWTYVNERAGFEIQLPTEPGIILITAAWAYTLVLRGPRRIPRHPLLLAIGLVVGWMMVSSTTSVYLRDSLFQSVAVTGFALVGAVLPMLELRRTEEIERVLRVYIVSGALVSIVGIVQVATSPLPFTRAAFFVGEGLLYNHGPFTAFLGFAMGPTFVYLVGDRWSARSVPLLLAAVLLLAATVVSLARAAWLATLVLLLVLAATRARVFFRKMAIPLALATLALGVAFLRSPSATQGLEDYVEVSTSAEYSSNVERVNRWIAAGRMFLARPITGVGPGAYEMAYEQYRDIEFSRGRRGSHSELIRAASEQGLPGVAILVFLVIVFYRTGLRLMRTAADPRVRRLAAAICAGMLTYTVHCFFNEYWRVPKIALTMWVFVGLLGALDLLAREARADPATPTATPRATA